MTLAAITDLEFDKFREFFYRKTGIQFEPSKRYFVDRRLIERIEDTRTGDFRTYFNLLRFDLSGDELQRLTNLMTVNETYFFREEYQFQCLVRSILPAVVARRTHRGPIRIWVIPSSSGEEPYSIAIYLLEQWPDLQRWDVEIVASDIDTHILEQARRALYSERSVRGIPVSVRQRYFTHTPEGYQLGEMVRNAVHFTRVNLASAAETRNYRNFDVVFCRNLLIYFDDSSRRSAVETLYEATVPGGYVCLGHSESMSRMSGLFKPSPFPEAIVHQKPLEKR